LKALFEEIEPGSGKQLDAFMDEAAYKYEVGINKLVHKPGLSLTEFADMDLVKGIFKLDVFASMKKHVQKHFTDPRLRELMEFPVLFLGALPEKIPALYSLMNYADVKLGTWFPVGGMYEIVKAMHRLAEDQGVRFLFNQNVEEIKTVDGKATGVVVNGEYREADVIVSGADYHFTETKLLHHHDQSYSEAYWNNRVMAPSCLLYYVGLNTRLKNVLHHSLFFDTDFTQHGKEIYDTPQWPSDPLFYVSATTQTDPSGAPEGCENLFFLIPVAAGLEGDTEELRDQYFQQIVARFEQRIGEPIADSIVYKKSYSVTDFVDDYNAFRGNAYGLANTLLQTAILKPGCRSKKVENLYYTGQLTVPGPGVPPSLISGEVVATLINKQISKPVQTAERL
jgi:phytoene desaturase